MTGESEVRERWIRDPTEQVAKLKGKEPRRRERKKGRRGRWSAPEIICRGG